MPRYIPTRLACTANEDHDTRAAYAELDWPASLTDDDRAWLRAHVRLNQELAEVSRRLARDTP